jgi:hypothetical protein
MLASSFWFLETEQTLKLKWSTAADEKVARVSPPGPAPENANAK